MVTIGLVQTTYPVDEEDSSGAGSILNVCLYAVSGHVDRTVVIYLSATDGSAIGESIIH